MSAKSWEAITCPNPKRMVQPRTAEGLPPAAKGVRENHPKTAQATSHRSFRLSPKYAPDFFCYFKTVPEGENEKLEDLKALIAENERSLQRLKRLVELYQAQLANQEIEKNFRAAPSPPANNSSGASNRAEPPPQAS